MRRLFSLGNGMFCNVDEELKVRDEEWVILQECCPSYFEVLDVRFNDFGEEYIEISPGEVIQVDRERRNDTDGSIMLSGLIARLQEIMEREGDIQVGFDDDENGWYPVKAVEIYEAYDNPHSFGARRVALRDRA